jgi:hypothetical protein
MTRTDVVASSRPQKADAAPARKGLARSLAVLPVAFALTMALLLPTTALAAGEGLSGYNKTTTTTTTTPTTPKTTPTTSTPKTTPTPTTGTSPSKESSTPEKTTAPEKTSEPAKKTSEPTATTAAKKTLPFTGFDLRWTVGLGLLLLAMGVSIVVAQRRQRRRDDSL